MIIIGELINASRKSIASHITNSDGQAIQNLAKDQYNAGANYIDINAGVFTDREIEYLKWMIKLVQEVVSIPCCIDSPNPKAIEAAMAVHDGTPMINSISLEKDRFDQLLPVVAGTDLKVVALCMSEEGMPETADQRLRIADKLINELVSNNVALENIYVDPLVQPISVNQSFGNEFLDAIEQIMTTFKGVHTTCGLSNISYGLPNRQLLNRQFMGLAISRGLDSAIVDPLNRSMMEVILATETLCGKDEYCRNYLKNQRDASKETKVTAAKTEPIQLDSSTAEINGRRIQTALNLGVADQIPFILNVNGPYFSYFNKINTMDYYDSPKVMLEAQLATYHYFGGTTTIGPEMSLAPEASALGAAINWSDDGTAWVEPFIETEADVDALQLPDLKNAGYMTKVFEYYEYMRANLDKDIPMTLGSANSPFTIAALVRGRGPRVFLETHGQEVDALIRILPCIDVVSMDWKLAADVHRVDESEGSGEDDFHDRHERFLRAAAAGCEVYVKVVVTVDTKPSQLDEICRRIAAIDPEIPLIIQPVTPALKIKESPKSDVLLPLLWGCEALLRDVRIIPQTHRSYDAL
jgi:dihydropteroate synthase